MKVHEKFREYIWLLNTIRKARKISFEELQEKWIATELSGGVELAKSTFHRHKEAIEDIFGLYIDCDKKNGYKYFIGNEEVLKEDSVQNWMLSTLSVGNVVSESMAVQSRILLEQVPCSEHLSVIIEAMKRNVRIDVTYCRYGSELPSHVNFEPYCIKLFKQRWYVLGHFFRAATAEKPESNYFGIYSFDRMQEVKLTDIKFEVAADFDVKAYFADCWGVFIGEDTKAETVVIRAYGKERFYLRDLPLHASQRSIAEGEDYEDFELHIRPTWDFCTHLLSKASYLQVLSPASLVEKMKNLLKETLARYE